MPFLEIWLRVLCLQIEDAHEPGWQHDLRDWWMLQSAGYFGGCISPSLDEFLTDDERSAAILGAAEHSIGRLRAFGTFVPATFLSALGLRGEFGGDLPIEWFERMAELFARLLRGELTTDASTSPTLPATRRGQTWDEIEQPRRLERPSATS